jgi:hypothetical protein
MECSSIFPLLAGYVSILKLNLQNDNSEVPTVGGHTNFRHAGVHVRPQPGSAVFFSYIDPSTNISDDGFTSHSGCPVYEGSKRIVTQWIRLGVDEENPFSSFSTFGVQHEKPWKEDNGKSNKSKVPGTKRKALHVNNIQTVAGVAQGNYPDDDDEESWDDNDAENEATRTTQILEQRSLKRRIVRARGSRVSTRPGRKYGSNIESKVRGQ